MCGWEDKEKDQENVMLMRRYLENRATIDDVWKAFNKRGTGFLDKYEIEEVVYITLLCFCQYRQPEFMVEDPEEYLSKAMGHQRWRRRGRYGQNRGIGALSMAGGILGGGGGKSEEDKAKEMGMTVEEYGKWKEEQIALNGGDPTMFDEPDDGKSKLDKLADARYMMRNRREFGGMRGMMAQGQMGMMGPGMGMGGMGMGGMGMMGGGMGMGMGMGGMGMMGAGMGRHMQYGGMGMQRHANRGMVGMGRRGGMYGGNYRGEFSIFALGFRDDTRRLLRMYTERLYDQMLPFVDLDGDGSISKYEFTAFGNLLKTEFAKVKEEKGKKNAQQHEQVREMDGGLQQGLDDMYRGDAGGAFGQVR